MEEAMDNSQYRMTPSLVIYGLVLHMSRTCLWHCKQRTSRALDNMHLCSREISVFSVIRYICTIKKSELILITYFLIPGNRVLFEKLNVSQLVKKFSALYGTRMFVTTFTLARHLSLS